MNLREGLGSTFLSHQERQAYKTMLQAFSAMDVLFDCTQIDRDVDLMKVLEVAICDNPSIIYFEKTRIKIEKSSSRRRVILTGVQPKPQAQKMGMALKATTNAAA